MKHLLIVYHSQSGSTRKLAEATFKGALLEADVETRLLRAMEAGTEDLLWCDAIIFGTPENLGYMSGGLKDFFDRTFYPAAPHQLNIAYGIVVSAGNDGTGAVRQIQRIAKGYPFREVAEPIIVCGEVGATGIQSCEELGNAMATGLSLGIF